ncbi:hypothetical protein MMAGJ_40000 [Mycolicibacterium mageritense]|uniref:DUF1364 family protein n=1 Tax=Mycolicibacterium mageritense TaxID=53462 RepID=A0ABM7HVU1_MYCME|nr:hypothetical protein MMAGJ_40000 [Mycolicibacterium mageritense]GJJ21358.1 hypothetical protein MTY414_50310 [Mycolicibacterium mageritense]
MDPHTVVYTFGGRLTTRGVRCDDENLVARPAEMLDHPKHRVGDAVDIREERLCNDCNAHIKMLPAGTVAEVSGGDTTRKNLTQREYWVRLLTCGYRARWRQSWLSWH